VSRLRTSANLSLAARAAARRLRVLGVQEAAGVFPTPRHGLDAISGWVARTVEAFLAYDEGVASAVAVYASKLRHRRRGFTFEYVKLLAFVEAIAAAPWSAGVPPRNPAPEDLTVRDLLERMRLKTVWGILSAIVITLAGAVTLGAWLERKASVLDTACRPVAPESSTPPGPQETPPPPVRHI
jgi:hypothetical protein